MNGRVYDPALGRFLSVDPVYQAPTNMQSLNPYSYVLNNPLSLTDPTGYVPESCTNGNECPKDNSTTTTATVTAKVTMTPTGSHVAQSVTVTATVSITTASGNSGNGQENQSQGAGSTLATSQGQGKGTSLGTGTVEATQNASSGQKGQSSKQNLFATQLASPSFTDAFDEKAAEEFAPLAKAADSAEDSWVQKGGIIGAIGGTFAAAANPGNIGNTIRQISLGALTDGLGGALNSAVSNLRTAYVTAVGALGDTAKALRAGGASEEVIARTLVDARNALKDAYRGPLKGILQGVKQPSYDDLILSGKSVDQIQQGAARTNAWVNKWLGATPP